MKKIMAITLILLIGLFVFSGCASTDVQPSASQDSQEETSPESQQSKQRTTGSVPQPPALPEE